MKEHRIPQQCGRCQHEWEDSIELPMPVESFIAKLTGFRCPVCGAKEVYLLLKPPNPFYVPDKSEQVEAQ